MSFRTCCGRIGISPLRALIAEILEFLQDGLDIRLLPNTIQRQVVALLSVLTCGFLDSLFQHTTICRFLRGVANICPPDTQVPYMGSVSHAEIHHGGSL